MANKEIDLYKIAQQDYHVLEEQIQANPTFLHQKDSSDRTLFHWSALQGRDRLIELILSFPGIEVDEVDDTLATPLVLATLGGHLETVKMLLAKGANINHKNWQGHSAFQYACSKGYKDIVLYLLENGADINILDGRKDTALHRVASQGREEILKILLTHNINLNQQNAENNTPLHLACEDEQNACALLLVEKGASIEILNNDKKSPLDLCKPSLRKQIKKKLGIKD